MDNSNLNISMKYNFAFFAGETLNVFRHGDHPLAEKVHIIFGSLEIPRMIAPNMINDFGSLNNIIILLKILLVLNELFTVKVDVVKAAFQI